MMFRWLSRYVKRIDIMGVGIELREIPEEEALPLLSRQPSPAPACPALAPPSSVPPEPEPPIVQKEDYVRVTGTSPSSRRAPREIDFMVDGEEIRIHIHQPGGTQSMMWVDRTLLQQSFGRWKVDSSGVAEVSIPARAAGKDAQVVFVADDSKEEIEVQTAWWIWVRKQDLKAALAELGVHVPW
jgi:hypothetical protein